MKKLQNYSTNEFEKTEEAGLKAIDSLKKQGKNLDYLMIKAHCWLLRTTMKGPQLVKSNLL